MEDEPLTPDQQKREKRGLILLVIVIVALTAAVWFFDIKPRYCC